MLWIQDLVRAHTIGVPHAIGNRRAVVHGVDMYVISIALRSVLTIGISQRNGRIGDLSPSRVHSRTFMEVCGYRYVWCDSTSLIVFLLPSPSFCVTELDPSSFTYAQKNVASNMLSNRVRVVKVNAANGDNEKLGDAMEESFGLDRLFEQIGGSELEADTAQVDESELISILCSILPAYAALVVP